MSDTQQRYLEARVAQHHTILLGAEGQGGLIREVDTLKEQVQEHEKKMNAVSLKWLILMLLAGALGNSVGSAVFQALQSQP